MHPIHTGKRHGFATLENLFNWLADTAVPKQSNEVRNEL